MRKMDMFIAGTEKKNPPLHIEVADSFFSRLRGLMGRSDLTDRQGLLIAPCSSIHMCFMRFPIDAVYINRDYEILKIVSGLHPWLGLSWCPGAWAVIELKSGESKRYGLAVGDKLNRSS